MRDTVYDNLIYSFKKLIKTITEIVLTKCFESKCQEGFMGILIQPLIVTYFLIVFSRN